MGHFAMFAFHLPTMCEYCYRSRLLISVAAGAAVGAALDGHTALLLSFLSICAAGVVAYVLPAIRNG